MTDSIPTVGLDVSEEERERLRNEFLKLGVTPETLDQTTEQPPPRRRPGRPKGSKTRRPSPSQFTPQTITEDNQLKPVPTLDAPPLTARDQREVAKRLEGILKGVTGVASVAKPYLAMTDAEAEAISAPLTTYLMRREQTSKMASQILEEYDVAAFVIALAAYVVRVYLDFQAERAATKNAAGNAVQSPDSDERRFTTTDVEAVRQSGTQSQEGEERPASRQFASVSQGGWTPSQV